MKTVIEMAREAGLDWQRGWTLDDEPNRFERLVELARADERRFIAEKWENWYGYDKEGVAEFIRKRANTQEET